MSPLPISTTSRSSLFVEFARSQAALLLAMLWMVGASRSALAQSLPRIALCGSAASQSNACEWTDVQSRLQNTGRFAAVDIVNATAAGGGTPSFAALASYDALLVWTREALADASSFGNVLADYVDSGGGVVVGAYANALGVNSFRIGGRWRNGYEVLVGGGGWNLGPASLGAVPQPGHPSMAGVSSLVVGHYVSSRQLAPGSTVIAESSLGGILVAEGAATARRLDVGFVPVASSCSVGGWTSGAGDTLLANALDYVARRARFVPFGVGCAGSLGVPTLRANPGGLPALGGTLSLTVGQLPSGLAVLVGGEGNAMVGGSLPLPLDLSAIGMTSCMLRVDPAASVALSGSGNAATWNLPVPNNQALFGYRFFLQAFSFDPAANALGFTATGGVRVEVGR
ncbi:MAG: hypothetical protein AB8H80_15395 [Planctomycetota bacterium]